MQRIKSVSISIDFKGQRLKVKVKVTMDEYGNIFVTHYRDQTVWCIFIKHGLHIAQDKKGEVELESHEPYLS